MGGAGLARREHWHQATLVLIEAAYLAALALMPERLWLQHRLSMLGAARIACGLVPSMRSATEGTAVLLRRSASEGWAGALVDWLRVGGGEALPKAAHEAQQPAAVLHATPAASLPGPSHGTCSQRCGALCMRASSPPHCSRPPSPPGAGTRLLVHAGCGIVVKMPLLALLTQQAAMMALSANARGYCTTPLLAHPLTRRRLHRVYGALDAGLTFVPYTPGGSAGTH